MSALGKVVRAGVGRRRVQAVVIALSLVMAVTAALVAGTMLAVSAGPFDRAFARQQGSQLTAEFDESKVTAAQLVSSGRVEGVAATAGPFQEATITPPGPPGMPGMPITVVGRASASGAVDRVDLLWGHWPSKPNEIVLSQDQIGSLYSHETDMSIASRTGSAVSLRVVGVASSVSLTAGGWVLPEEIGALRAVDPTRAAPTSQMLYRFQHASTGAELGHDLAAVVASVPRDALAGSRSWLDTKLGADQNAAVVVPIIGAFGLLGLAMSVVVVAAVVSGAVGSSTRRIGVLKALGFTPDQLGRAYVAQALVPAAVGTALGLLLGNVAAQPLLGEAQQGYQVGALTVPWWLDVVVPSVALLIVALSALVPALRAGRMSTVAALAIGRGGGGTATHGSGTGVDGAGRRRSERGAEHGSKRGSMGGSLGAPQGASRQDAGRTPQRRRRVQEAVGRLPLPRPVSLGLASSLAHPVRTAGMLTAVLLGTVTATFAVGLTSSAGVIGQDRHPDGRAAVAVAALANSAGTAGTSGSGTSRSGTNGSGTGGAPGVGGPLIGGPLKGDAGRRAVDVVRTAADTGSWYAVTDVSVSVADKTGAVSMSLFQGDSTKAAYDIISGRWFSSPGEVVAPTHFLTSTGTRVGDTITLVDHGERVQVRIVGEDFDTQGNGMDLSGDLRTLPRELASGTVDFIHADPRAGVRVDSYVAQLNDALKPLGAGATVNAAGPGGSMVVVIEAMSVLLTLMLLATAALGILNSVVLDTRERVRDLGVCRALGMTPGQTTAQVLVTVAVIGLLGGAVGAPLGIALHHSVMPLVLHAVGSNTPARVQNVFGGVEMAVLVLGGTLLAVAGGLLPATWASKARTAMILRTE